jgi:hypothetical protein
MDYSFSARAQLAVQLGIVKKASDYKGTAAQNTAMLASAKKTNLGSKADTKQQPAKQQPTKEQPATQGKTAKDVKNNNPNDKTQLAKNVDTKVTTGVNSTAEDWTDLYNQIVQTAIPNGGQYSYDKIATMDVNKPEFRTAADLAAATGLDYNYDNIYNTLMKSVNAGHDAQLSEQKASEGKYYDNAATAQSTLAETLAQQQAQAIQVGTNRGMQAANALSSVLGVSQQFAGNATNLANQRSQIAKDYAAQQAQTGVNAMNQYNDIGKYLGDLSKHLYSSDTSAYVGQLDYNAGVNAANAQMASQQMASQSQYQTALASNFADIMNQYYSGQITLEQAKIAADAQVQAAKVYGVDAATVTAASNEAIAKTNAAASNYAADQNYAAAQYNADKNYAASTYTADKNYDSNTYVADQNRSASDYQAQMNWSANMTNSQRNQDANKYTADMQANTAKQQTAGNAITGLITGYNSGAMSAEDANNALYGYYQAGIIDASTYNTVSNIFKVQ